MELSKKQSQFLEQVLAGRSLYLSGKAGTGKSTVVRLAIEQLQAQGRKVAAVAPTGVAANNIGGQTIHSLFGIRPFGVSDFSTANFMKSEKRRMMDAIDTFFIDEVSMVRPDLLDAMHWTLEKNRCFGLDRKQVVFIGDMKQLPPILDDNTRTVLMEQYMGDRFYHASIYRKLNVEDIELDEILRQSDTEFIDALNMVREGQKEPYFNRFIGPKPNGGVVLAPYNATVQQYNEAGLRALPGPEHVFEAEITGDKVNAGDYNLEPRIAVKHGAKVMYLANSKTAPLFNGTVGTFIEDGGKFFIEVDGMPWHLEPITFSKNEYVLDQVKNKLTLKEVGSITQLPIRLAYALSIHKSQGMTFDEVTIDLRKPCFQAGQLYVALSRVRTPEGLRIII